MIQIREVAKRFGTQQVLKSITLTIRDGGTTAILGPSGTGKSVLLKIIVGLLPADAGEVMIGSESMTGARSSREREAICAQMGVLFQAAALFDSMTLVQNVQFPLEARRLCGATEAKSRAIESLRDVGLSGYEHALPGQVSIGIRKRVGIARALVTNPTILLFDEPNTGLDPQTGQEIYELIRETQQRSGFTGIVVSHEIPEVFQVCDRVAMLYQGVVQAEGTVEEFLTSPNPAVQQFVKGDVTGPIQITW